MRIHTAALTFVVALTSACGGRVGDDAVRSAGGTSGRGGASSIGGTSNSSGFAGSGFAGSGGMPGDAGPGSPGGTPGLGGAPSSGGGPSHGGAGGAGSAAACVAPSVCGGTLVGTWAVVSSCLTVEGQLDLTALGLSCATAAVTGHHQVTGTWSARPDGSYADYTTTTGEDQIQANADCLVLSGVAISCEGFAQFLDALGYFSTACTAAPRGGCVCSAIIRQSGGLGLVSPDPATAGNFSPSGNVFGVDDGAEYSYCASGDRLTVTPKTVTPATSGAIEFQLVVP